LGGLTVVVGEVCVVTGALICTVGWEGVLGAGVDTG
jgi:hypothetical protein